MGRGGGEKEKKNEGEGVREEMPCIPLSGQRKPQKEERGGEETTEMREKYRKRRRRGRGEGRGWAGIRPPYIKTDRDRKGGL